MLHMSESFEEVLVRNLKPYGPVFAIADPRSRWRPAGAARLWVPGTGEEWKGEVSNLLDRSSLVVMIVGKTPGVTWEVREVISRNIAAKLWLVFPPAEPGDVTERWHYFRDELRGAGHTETPEDFSWNRYLEERGIKPREIDEGRPLLHQVRCAVECPPEMALHSRT